MTLEHSGLVELERELEQKIIGENLLQSRRTKVNILVSLSSVMLLTR
jgi:hypothetical protein